MKLPLIVISPNDKQVQTLQWYVVLLAGSVVKPGSVDMWITVGTITTITNRQECILLYAVGTTITSTGGGVLL